MPQPLNCLYHDCTQTIEAFTKANLNSTTFAPCCDRQKNCIQLSMQHFLYLRLS